MKKDQVPATHPVDRFFQEQEPHLPIQFEPAHWASLEVLLDDPALVTKREIETPTQPNHRSDKSLFRLLGLFLLCFLFLGSWYLLTPEQQLVSVSPERELSTVPVVNSSSLQSDNQESLADSPLLATVAEAAEDEEPARPVRSEWRAVMALPSIPLPQQLQSIQPKPPMRLKLTKGLGESTEELFIFW